MRTPSDPQHVAREARRGTPAAAVVRAWLEPGPHPDWHERARVEVRRTMPVLAAALDRLAGEMRAGRETPPPPC